LELARTNYVVLQQMEHDNMASDSLNGQQVVDERKQPRDPRTPAPRLAQGGPPLVNEGLEVPRGVHC
jgi:hypothetical protein